MTKSSKIIGLTLSTALVVIGILYFTRNSMSGYNIGYYAGQNLIPVVVLLLIVQRFILKERAKRFKTGIFLLAYGASILGSLMLVEVKDREEVAGLEHIFEQTSTLLEAQDAIISGTENALIDENFAVDPGATGSMAVMQQFISETLNRYASFSNDYVVELDAIGWPMILDVNRLQADKSYSESRELIAEARRVMTKYRVRSEELIAMTEKRIEYMDLPDTTKENFRQGYLKSSENMKVTQVRVWELEGSTINEFESIIDFLAENPHSWDEQGSQYLFEDQLAVDQYNRLFANIDQLIAEQTKLQHSSNEAQQQRLEQLKASR